MSNYGPLAGVVGTVGAILSAGGAITLAWKRGADWLPPEDDVPKGPARVAGVLTTIAIAAMWLETGRGLDARDLERISGISAATTVLSLLAYVFLMSVFVYQRRVINQSGQEESRRLIGGFLLTSAARTGLQQATTVQRLLDGAGNDPDLVWTRASRAMAKICFIVAFLGLQVSGSLAVSAIALSLDAPTTVGKQTSPIG
jgi:hypothetical protein